MIGSTVLQYEETKRENEEEKIVIFVNARKEDEILALWSVLTMTKA